MERNGKILLIIIAIICVVLTGVIYINRRNSEQIWFDSLSSDTLNIRDEAPENANITKTSTIKVYITGAVLSPGVYDLSEGSRVNDVLEMAGGATENADLESINLAAYVKDAEKIVIPDITKKFDNSETPVQNESNLININTATLEELKTLPGVGDVIAGNIISYREKNGYFESTEDIKKVPRIGDKTYLQLMDLITV